MASATPVKNQSSKEHEEKQYNEIKGDLFSCPDTYSLAHCVSADCRMGKGIAVIFKKKFRGVDELLSQKKKTGDVAILKRGERFIYYLITKTNYYDKPSLGTLKLSLQAMREHCRTHKVEHLAMPRIGCGLDGLKWPIVSDMIQEIFSDTEIKITVYLQ